MPEVEIRPAVSADIPELIKLEHSYQTDYVWQMDRNMDEGHIGIGFREVRLPRSVKVDYPHQPEQLLNDWTNRSGVLVAALRGLAVGYACVNSSTPTSTAWITDLVIDRGVRRQGVGTALILGVQDWADHQRLRRAIMVMQSKNYPAIRLALRLGYEFCGYNDYYYSNQDIALFFSRFVR